MRIPPHHDKEVLPTIPLNMFWNLPKPKCKLNCKESHKEKTENELFDERVEIKALEWFKQAVENKQNGLGGTGNQGDPIMPTSYSFYYESAIESEKRLELRRERNVYL